MASIDWIIFTIYLISMVVISYFLGRNQKNMDDYYVGGRKVPWWAVGISTMATQTSAISFISIPAFVAIKKGGGLTWLQYELAVPLAMIVVMAIVIPVFRQMKLITVYEFLELRFSSTIRYLVSFMFLLSRGLATGVGVYAIAIVLAVCLQLPLWSTILIIGFTTILYDTIGGIKAVIYSDVIQSVILFIGIFICIYFAVVQVGGIKEIFRSFPAERMTTIDLSDGINDYSDVPFWAFLFGGLFLYISYYGTDQSQVQRELSAGSVKDTHKSLFLNGIVRFPLTLLYVTLGIVLFSVYHNQPGLASQIDSQSADHLVPYFILQLPAGIRGLLFASILAAAMSSLDSALNSLSAITMNDFIKRFKPELNNELSWSKLSTVVWGILITGFAFYVGDISDTIIEGINKIGSAFYGPILATFIVGIVSRKIGSIPILIGFVSGVVINLILWVYIPGIYWMWWNLIGFFVCTFVAIIVNLLIPCQDLKRTKLKSKTRFTYSRQYPVLILYFVLIMCILLIINSLT